MDALNPEDPHVAGHAALEAGRPWPLGAHADAEGVNFAVFSAHAESIELCLFGTETAPAERETRIVLPARTGDVWHGYLRGAAAGLIYGLRAHGPWRPQMGHKFNAAKLLLDPYAREIVGRFEWRAEQFGHDPAQGPRGPMSSEDNAQFALKARVVEEDSWLASHRAGAFDWGEDRLPRTRLADTVLYEAHVKGYTKLHPGVPEPLRGTYAGLASEAGIAHLRRLGVTAVSLLPVHQHIDEERLVRLGLSNYWGYNTIGFFVPEPSYAASGAEDARDEFKAMVKRLHGAGIEVILDVVFNHSAETDELGPLLSWRGLDNASYYRLPGTDRALYENQTGCGNTFDFRQPRVLQLAMDSLRYWAQHMHVDGFRFDLAPVLGRTGRDGGFEPLAPFFQAVAQDPVLQQLKLIAEPWDIGTDGYHLGQFPAGWLEWNDRYRDTLRGFWLGARGEPPANGQSPSLGGLAQRLCASDDLFDRSLRQAAESVNFIVAHDGFTLHDLVSYDDKHNEANGEHNRDGAAHNLSWNCGAEGPSSDPAVQALRSQLKRALLALLLLSQGTPMLAAGDELGHTQGGNNNPYCQDNVTTWIDWSNADEELIGFTAALIRVRRALMPLGRDWNDHLDWLRPDGQPMGGEDWNDGARRALGCLVARPERGGAPLLLLLNSSSKGTRFSLDPAAGGGRWQCVLDSGSGYVAPAYAEGAGTGLAPSAVGGIDGKSPAGAPPASGDASPDARVRTWSGEYPLGPRAVALLAALPSEDAPAAPR